MLFNSSAFMLFLPIVFGGYWLICYPKQGVEASSMRLKLQNLFLLLANYVFYGWLDWKFLYLIAFISFWAWGSGFAISESAARGISKKLMVTIALIVNFSILGVFKYYGFFAENIVALLNALGFQANPSSFKIILPIIGLSFYTFQAAGYIIDVYRGTVQPCRDILAFLAYMSFFPQILAGPIARATEQLPQFQRTRHFEYALAVDGSRQMLWGFFKKFAVADSCAVYVDTILEGTANPAGIGIVTALFLYAAQIYCDFSGYSDLAIGCAKLLGFRLPQNFNFPYFATNIADFWRRWHMSLMRWFKDYLYIPLGGSRVDKARHIRNVFAVFLVSGLWHGANWTFIFWGVFHACAFLPRLLSRKVKKGEETPSRLRAFFGWLLTMVTVTLGWVIFRAPSLSALKGYLVQIPHFGTLSAIKGQGLLAALELVVIAFIVEWFGRHGEYALQKLPRSVVLRWLIYIAVVWLICSGMPSNGGDFIYGQF